MSDRMKLTCLKCGTVNGFPADKLGAGPKCSNCKTPLADGRVMEINPKILDKAARNDSLPLVVDFWASWCGPCRMMAPEFEKAARELKGVARLAKLNTEKYPDISMRFHIRGIRSMLIFRNGREIARQAGAMPAAGIVQCVRNKAGRR